MSSMNRENQVLTNSTKNNNSNFVQPKTFVKRPSNNRNRDFNVPTTNRFQSLESNDENDVIITSSNRECNDNHGNESIGHDKKKVINRSNNHNYQQNNIDGNKNVSRKKRSVTILGDSIVKGIQGHKMKLALNNTTFNSFKLILEENYTFIWPELLANKCQITYMHMK